MPSTRETFELKGVIAVYPKISKPDTYGPKADGKYKTDISFTDPKRSAAFKAGLIKKAKELLPKVKTPKYPFKINAETEEITFRLASKFQPLVFDAKNNPLPDGVLIGGGSILNIIGAFNGYDDRLSLYLNAVQVIKLVEYKPKSRDEYDSPFAATEGFAYEGESEETSDDTASDAGETAESSDEGTDPLEF